MEDLFQSKNEMKRLLEEWVHRKLPICETRVGLILGSKVFIENSMDKFNRRKISKENTQMRKIEENIKNALYLIETFEKEKGVKLEELDFHTLKEKKIHSELLVILKEKVSLTYKEIMKLQYFKDVQFSSLGVIYKRGKK